MKRSRLKPMSAKRRRENAARRKITMLHYCEARKAGAPGLCSGPLTRHEVLPRARGGSVLDPDNIRTVCSEHNRCISQNVETMRWAAANGFLKHSWEKTA